MKIRYLTFFIFPLFFLMQISTLSADERKFDTLRNQYLKQSESGDAAGAVRTMRMAWCYAETVGNTESKVRLLRDMAVFHQGKSNLAKTTLIIPLLQRALKLAAGVSEYVELQVAYELKEISGKLKNWQAQYDALLFRIDVDLESTNAFYADWEVNDAVWALQQLKRPGGDELRTKFALCSDMLARARLSANGSHMKDAVLDYLAARKIAGELHLPRTVAYTQDEIARLYIEFSGANTTADQLQPALDWQQASVDYYQSIGQIEKLSNAHRQLGILQFRAGKTDAAVHSLQTAFQDAIRAGLHEQQADIAVALLPVLEKHNPNQHAQLKRNIAGICHAATSAILQQGGDFLRYLNTTHRSGYPDVKQNLQRLETALELAWKSGSAELQAQVLEQRAEFLLMQERRGDAIAALRKAAGLLGEDHAATKTFYLAKAGDLEDQLLKLQKESSGTLEAFGKAAATALQEGKESEMLAVLRMIDLNGDSSMAKSVKAFVDAKPAAVQSLAAQILEGWLGEADLDFVGARMQHKNPDVCESMAAILYRLDGDAPLPFIQKALQAEPTGPAEALLRGALAKRGDLEQLRVMEDLAKADHPTVMATVLPLMTDLGFLTYRRSLDASVESDNAELHRALGRNLARYDDGWSTSTAFGGLFNRNIKDKVDYVRTIRQLNIEPNLDMVGLLNNDPVAISYLVVPKRGGVFGPRLFYPARRAAKDRLAANPHPLNAYLAVRLDVDDAIESVPAGPMRTVAESLQTLDETEQRFRTRQEQSTRLVHDPEGGDYAVYTVDLVVTETSVNGKAVDIYASATIDWDVVAGGIIGALFKEEVMIEMGGNYLDPFVNVVLVDENGVEVKGGVGWLDDKTLRFRFTLPENSTIDSFRGGMLHVELAFFNDQDILEIPLGVTLPPSRNAPDLIPTLITLSPAQPNPGAGGEILLTIVNMGKKIDDGVTVDIALDVENPLWQNGRRPLGVITAAVGGMRPAESRVFTLQQQFPSEYFVNHFSLRWEPEMGDTVVHAVVDPPNVLQEASESNNTLRQQVALFFDDDEGKRLAAEELSAQLQELFDNAGGDLGPEERARLMQQARDLIRRAEQRSPELALADNMLSSSAAQQRARDAMASAIERLGEALRNGDTSSLNEIARDLAAAQGALLASGFPVRYDDLKSTSDFLDILNTRLSMGNDTGFFEALAGETGGEFFSGFQSLLGDVGNAVATAQLLQGVAENRRINVDDYMGVAGSYLGMGGGPAFNSVVGSVFKENMKWNQQGWDLITDGMDSVNGMIDGDPDATAQYERVAAGLREWSRGPYTPESIGNIVEDQIKSIPGVGSVYKFLTE